VLYPLLMCCVSYRCAVSPADALFALYSCCVPYVSARAWDAAALGGMAPNGPGRLREALGSGASELGLSLLAQLLCLDPMARITAKQAMQHPFLAGGAGKVELPKQSAGPGDGGGMGGFAGLGGVSSGGGAAGVAAGGAFAMGGKAAQRAELLQQRRGRRP